MKQRKEEKRRSWKHGAWSLAGQRLTGAGNKSQPVRATDSISGRGGGAEV